MPTAVPVSSILEACCKHFAINPADMIGRSKGSITQAKRMFCAIARDHTLLNRGDIADQLAMNISSVRTTLQVHDRSYASDELYRCTYDHIKGELGL